MKRLSNDTIGALPEIVAAPSYDRSIVKSGVVHLGIGAFHRAHQAVVFEAALESGDLRWGITGASLRSAGVRDEMNPQDGLYTVVTRDGSGDSLKVMGVVREVLAAPENPEALVERLAHSDTHIVTLTVTEKGYKLDPATGALLAGVLIAETDYHSEVEVMTAPFKGLALGVFLITVGMSLDLASIMENWPALLAAIVAVVAVKALVTFGLLKFAGIRNGVAAETGLLMGSPSETTLIVLGTAAQARLIMPDTASFWQTVTAIGLTITPLLAWLGQRVARRIELRGGSNESEAEIPVAGPGTVVIGFGRVGRMVADMLKVHDQPFIAVEADIDAVKAARAEGYPVIFGDVSRSELVDRLNLGRAKALILTMDDPVLSVQLTRRVRSWVPNLTIVTRARDTAHAAELYRAGATDAVPETLESSLQLSEALLVDLGIAVGPVIASIHEKRDELRKEIKEAADMVREPRLRRARKATIET